MSFLKHDYYRPATGITIARHAQRQRLGDYKLIAFDMDSTLINIECVDEIADAVGCKDEVAAITEAAMRGEITDYKDSLRRRVALLRGATVADLEYVYAASTAQSRRPGVGAGLPAGRAQNPARVGRIHLLYRTSAPAPAGWISRVRTFWKLHPAPIAEPSPAVLRPSVGATYAMALKSAARYWKWPACWVSGPKRVHCDGRQRQ